MSSSGYQLITLPNGLRIAHVPIPYGKVINCGFVIHAGSRNDGSIDGMAHFLEHMFFKGTKKRKTHHVLNHLEVVGGELNAFTTKEITALYAQVQRKDFARAVDILYDVTFQSVFPEKEILKEKRVILDEINMYRDTPEENIYDEFQELLFKEHPLAHNILGTPESIQKIDKHQLDQFVHRNYNFDNMVFVVVGNISQDRVLKTVEKHLPLRESVGASYSLNDPMRQWKYSPFHETKESDFGQAYTMMGVPTYAETHEERFSLMLLNNLLGGPGMNSRLNLAIREKYGYTYNIESGYQPYSDTGMFHCYLSCEEKYMDRSIFLMEKELKRLKEKKLGRVQLSQAKKQLCGQLMMANESKSSLLVHVGKGILKYGRAKTVEETISQINQISAEKLLTVANEVFNLDSFSYLRYTPSR